MQRVNGDNQSRMAAYGRAWSRLRPSSASKRPGVPGCERLFSHSSMNSVVTFFRLPGVSLFKADVSSTSFSGDVGADVSADISFFLRVQAKPAALAPCACPIFVRWVKGEGALQRGLGLSAALFGQRRRDVTAYSGPAPSRRLCRRRRVPV